MSEPNRTTRVPVRPLKDPARSQQRVDFLAEAFRGLLLVHGGGAVALLAFFQSLLPSRPQLARVVLLALLCLAIGLVLALVFMILRYFTSLEEQRQNPGWRRYQNTYYVCMWSSVACFLISMMIVVVGGFYYL